MKSTAIISGSAVISDHAVLQRDVGLPLRGTARPHTAVTITFGPDQWTVQSDAQGVWQVTLGPFVAGGPHNLSIATADGGTRIVRDLLVGDVWVCAGQSNMEMALQDSAGGPAAAAVASLPRLRLLKVPPTSTLEPQTDLPTGSQWQLCDPAAAAGFSAIGFYFGRQLLDHANVPIGLIQAAVSNTPGEAWMAMDQLQDDPDFAPIFDRWRRSLAVYPDPAGVYAKAFWEWDAQTDQAERAGRPIPGAHPKLIGPGHIWTPAGLWNGMIAPLTAVPIRGVIWYQGAGAPERAFQYRKLFRQLIRDWRRAWGVGDFPFLFLQEANFGPKRADPGEHSWAELREAQQLALAEPCTAMGVALDVGEEQNIHPVQKQPLGDRLARAARALVYGEKIPWSSPFFQSMEREGARIRLRFTATYGRLTTVAGSRPTGFSVSPGAVDFSAGHRNFVWADAQIEGDAVVVGSDRVPAPVAVRYSWAQNPAGNIVNAIGLPLAPFRTDNWPGITVHNR